MSRSTVLPVESHTWSHKWNYTWSPIHGITYMESHTWNLNLAMQDLEMMKMTIKRLLAPVKHPASPSAPPPPAPAPPKRPPPPPPPGLPTAAALGSIVEMQQVNAVCPTALLVQAASLLHCSCAQTFHQQLYLLLCAPFLVHLQFSCEILAFAFPVEQPVRLPCNCASLKNPQH